MKELRAKAGDKLFIPHGLADVSRSEGLSLVASTALSGANSYYVWLNKNDSGDTLSFPVNVALLVEANNYFD